MTQVPEASEHTSALCQLLHHVQSTEAIRDAENRPTITRDEFRGKLLAWRESTSTSPSGIHLGHYKAMVGKHLYSDNPQYKDSPEQEELYKIQDDLVPLHLNMINYALERGYSYHRWQLVANTVLFKDSNNYRIHRTRIIHLYEADYNLAMGLKWRVAVCQAEALKKLNAGQYGSRPMRSAQDPVALEKFQFEIARSTRKPLVQVNYDATSCYDRIIPNLAMLVSEKNGVSKRVTQTNSLTLERNEYQIKTDLGMSPEGYCHSEASPIYGTGQGSGNFPAIWCFISSPLFECYDLQANGARYCFPDRSGQTQINMWGMLMTVMGRQIVFSRIPSGLNLTFSWQLNAMQNYGRIYCLQPRVLSKCLNVPIIAFDGPFRWMVLQF